MVGARRVLDLASNALQQVDGLGGLVRLERLSLAHNRITSLAGLSDLQVRPPGRPPVISHLYVNRGAARR